MPGPSFIIFWDRPFGFASTARKCAVVSEDNPEVRCDSSKSERPEGDPQQQATKQGDVPFRKYPVLGMTAKIPGSVAGGGYRFRGGSAHSR